MANIILNRRDAVKAFIASTSAFIFPQRSIAESGDIFSLISSVANNVSQELQSPLSRFGLLEFSYEFALARIKTAPLGYEKEPNFRSMVDDVSASLNKILLGNEEAFNAKRFDVAGINDYSKKMAQSFQLNNENESNSSKVVFARLRQGSPALAILSDGDITHLQIIVSAILSSDKSAIKIASQFTYIYPFCYRGA